MMRKSATTWIFIVAAISALLASITALGMTPWVPSAEVEKKYETKEHAQEVYQRVDNDLQYIRQKLDKVYPEHP